MTLVGALRMSGYFEDTVTERDVLLLFYGTVDEAGQVMRCLVNLFLTIGDGQLL